MNISDDLTFGEAVRQLRQKNGWTARDLIGKLKQEGRPVSPAYITRIEQYDESPTPEFIFDLSRVFGINHEVLLDLAKRMKVELFRKSLEAKYDRKINLLADRVKQGKERYGSKG